jgi:hypothetical protein
LVLTLALTACGGSPMRTHASPYQRLVEGYVAYARCARSHGMPNLPDPQVDDQGNDHYPALDRRGPWRWPRSVLIGCSLVWERVHAIRDEFDSAHAQPPLQPATYAQELALARCIRAHGFPTYPDPGPNGSSRVDSLPAGFAKANLAATARAAINACSHGGSG